MSYLALAALFLAASLVVLVLAWRVVRPSRDWWLATAAVVVVLVVLTVVFDSVMIAADLFRYDRQALTGITVGLAPVEDLAWPVAAGTVLPAMRALLDHARRHGVPAERDQFAGSAGRSGTPARSQPRPERSAS